MNVSLVKILTDFKLMKLPSVDLTDLAGFTVLSITESQKAQEVFASVASAAKSRVCRVALDFSEVFEFSGEINQTNDITAQVRKRICLETPFVDNEIYVSHTSHGADTNIVSGVVVYVDSINEVLLAAAEANIDVWDIVILDDTAKRLIQVWKPGFLTRSNMLARLFLGNRRFSIPLAIFALLLVGVFLQPLLETPHAVEQSEMVEKSSRSALDAQKLTLLATVIDSEINDHAIIFDASTDSRRVLTVGDSFGAFQLKSISESSIELLSRDGKVFWLGMWHRGDR